MGELWVAQKSVILFDRKVLLIQRSNYAGVRPALWLRMEE